MVWKAMTVISILLAIGAFSWSVRLQRELNLTIEAHNSLSEFAHLGLPHQWKVEVKK